ncbi:MAG: hypothetical protein A3H28_05030 [Acidobacteria bacterium RIFCSPLOWO2_02_FULL_61_28]|nr:MAG: hypothetical protein A3H28_05030 [Acidobacteria bacterium RIFCSPLOWO2_02_FULL_61_28]
MQWVLVTIVVLAPLSVARAETVFEGTIIVLKYTQQKASIAADSRANIFSVSGNQGYRDDHCKIAALTDEFLFASAGVRGLGTGRVGESWDVNEEARSAFRTATLLGLGNIVEETARRWGGSVAFRINQMLASQRETLLEEQRTNMFFADAIFIGLEKGSLSVWRALILDDNGSVRAELRVLEPPGFGAFGMHEIFDEFAIEERQTSERAKAERAQWEREFSSKDAADRDILWVIRLVDLTIAFHPRPEKVGGPIDASELSRGGKVRWYQRKQQCPAN